MRIEVTGAVPKVFGLAKAQVVAAARFFAARSRARVGGVWHEVGLGAREWTGADIPDLPDTAAPLDPNIKLKRAEYDAEVVSGWQVEMALTFQNDGAAPISEPSSIVPVVSIVTCEMIGSRRPAAAIPS